MTPADPPEPRETTRLNAVTPHAAPAPDPRMDPGTTSPDVEPAPVMHDFAAGFEYLAGLINEGNRTTNALASVMAERHFESQQRFRRLEKKVFGHDLPPLLTPSKRPPPPGASISMPSLPPVSIASSPPLAAQAAQQGGEIDALTLRFESVEAKVQTIEAMTAQQSRAMGVVPKPQAGSDDPDPSATRKAATFIFSVPGFVALAALIAALTGLVTAVRGQAPPSPPLVNSGQSR